MREPAVQFVDWEATHRLIPSRFSETGTVLSALADNSQELEDLILLDGATNDRIQGEQRGLVGISTYELVYGIPNAQIVNAAFTHTHESGSRFNDHTRGAWYAADRLEGSLAEVTYHKARRLGDIIVPEESNDRPSYDISTVDDWLADFRSQFHALEPTAEFSRYLQAEPIPACYVHSQALARELLHKGSNGITYPSVRHSASKCIVCFRPALVYNPRKSKRFEITLTASDMGYDHTVLVIPDD